MEKLRFNEALRLAAEAANDPQLPAAWPVMVVRDVYGKLRFAVDAHRPRVQEEEEDEDEEKGNVDPDNIYPVEAYQRLLTLTSSLGAYATAQQVLFRDDFSNPDALFKHPDWHDTVLPGWQDADGGSHSEIAFRLLDRQIVGQDWLRTVQRERTEKTPPRVVFYGLKGGVGRSTALSLLAYSLAREGKRVLLVDFDLESPGLSGLLLPPDRVASYGLVDWFVEDAVSPGDDILADLVADSPLSEHTPGRIRVAAASGQSESGYLSKLARVYADVPARLTPDGARHGDESSSAGLPAERFAERMARLIQLLEQQEKPDIVLIDSRAGLHDLAAVSIVLLADLALLFATDTEQTWQGYGQLFAHWRQRPDVLRAIRERLWMVRAMFPENEQQQRFERFLEKSWDLFAENVYDRIEPESPPSIDVEVFSFAKDDEGAPHFPLMVRWNARFMEFDQLAQRDRGGMGDADIDLAFGPFVDRVKSILFED